MEKLKDSVQLNEDFTVKDLTVSTTAKEKGINNQPPMDYKENLEKLANALSYLKDSLGSFKILSAYRSPQLNSTIGGAEGSRHLYGEAVDITPLMQKVEQYYAGILADPELRNKLGEITYKPSQNAIHLTLPYGFTKASARILENGIYKTMKDERVKKLVADYYPDSDIARGATMTAGLGWLQSILIGLSGLTAFMFAKNKK